MSKASSHIVFVTGAGAGIGAATARRFASEGARVIAADRDPQRLTQTRSGLESLIHPLALDLRDRDAVRRAFDTLPEAFAAISILVNNAGVGPGAEPAQQANLDDWESIVDTNIKGVLYCTHAVLPGMVERNRGHIVNISSTAATNNYRGGNVYGGSKAFVRQFSLNLRCDLLGTRVRVSSIEPGMTQTRFTEVRFRDDPERTHAHYQGFTPLSGDDLADVIFYTTMLPEHVNINTLQVTPIGMAPAGYAIHRED
ncbi:MAG: SDR family NAD(P)-dependent oxidoreductase [Gammaproteobacteria bacterium]|nr:SDR family NAD(P)-dependent oxidoreductase [Gammaproteobacteria bacterium]